jgi:hypothetical protein
MNIFFGYEPACFSGRDCMSFLVLFDKSQAHADSTTLNFVLRPYSSKAIFGSLSCPNIIFFMSIFLSFMSISSC